jgi:hypothetical protein
MAIGINPQQAEILAIKALAYLADSPEILDRFALDNGVAVGDIRQHAGEKPFLVAILDFMLSDEGLLLEFAKSAQIDPKLIGLAHHMLSR